jgi:signal transduction histidine kinase
MAREAGGWIVPCPAHGTAIANAEARAALTDSRARIMAATDQARHRIVRDLHDGVQRSRRGDRGLLEEVRKIARGPYPAALADAGLRLRCRSWAAAQEPVRHRTLVQPEGDPKRLTLRPWQHVELIENGRT